jgi:hypothetical protein
MNLKCQKPAPTLLYLQSDDGGLMRLHNELILSAVLILSLVGTKSHGNSINSPPLAMRPPGAVAPVAGARPPARAGVGGFTFEQITDMVGNNGPLVPGWLHQFDGMVPKVVNDVFISQTQTQYFTGQLLRQETSAVVSSLINNGMPLDDAIIAGFNFAKAEMNSLPASLSFDASLLGQEGVAAAYEYYSDPVQAAVNGMDRRLGAWSLNSSKSLGEASSQDFLNAYAKALQDGGIASEDQAAMLKAAQNITNKIDTFMAGGPLQIQPSSNLISEAIREVKAAQIIAVKPTTNLTPANNSLAAPTKTAALPHESIPASIPEKVSAPAVAVTEEIVPVAESTASKVAADNSGAGKLVGALLPEEAAGALVGGLTFVGMTAGQIAVQNYLKASAQNDVYTVQNNNAVCDANNAACGKYNSLGNAGAATAIGYMMFNNPGLSNQQSNSVWNTFATGVSNDVKGLVGSVVGAGNIVGSAISGNPIPLANAAIDLGNQVKSMYNAVLHPDGCNGNLCTQNFPDGSWVTVNKSDDTVTGWDANLNHEVTQSMFTVNLNSGQTTHFAGIASENGHIAYGDAPATFNLTVTSYADTTKTQPIVSNLPQSPTPPVIAYVDTTNHDSKQNVFNAASTNVQTATSPMVVGLPDFTAQSNMRLITDPSNAPVFNLPLTLSAPDLKTSDTKKLIDNNTQATQSVFNATNNILIAGANDFAAAKAQQQQQQAQTDAANAAYLSQYSASNATGPNGVPPSGTCIGPGCNGSMNYGDGGAGEGPANLLAQASIVMPDLAKNTNRVPQSTTSSATPSIPALNSNDVKIIVSNNSQATQVVFDSAAAAIDATVKATKDEQAKKDAQAARAAADSAFFNTFQASNHSSGADLPIGFGAGSSGGGGGSQFIIAPSNLAYTSFDDSFAP